MSSHLRRKRNMLHALGRLVQNVSINTFSELGEQLKKDPWSDLV